MSSTERYVLTMQKGGKRKNAGPRGKAGQLATENSHVATGVAHRGMATTGNWEETRGFGVWTPHAARPAAWAVYMALWRGQHFRGRTTATRKQKARRERTTRAHVCVRARGREPPNRKGTLLYDPDRERPGSPPTGPPLAFGRLLKPQGGHWDPKASALPAPRQPRRRSAGRESGPLARCCADSLAAVRALPRDAATTTRAPDRTGTGVKRSTRRASISGSSTR